VVEDGIPLGNVSQHGRRVEGTRAAACLATGHDVRAALDAARHQVHHLVDCTVVDHRADLHRLIHAATHGHLGHCRGESLGEIVVDAGLGDCRNPGSRLQ
jgi:hypothetical protein